jgi:zinc protease
LPPRRAAFDPRNDQRDRRFASDLSSRTLIHRGEADQAVVISYWPARDDNDLAESVKIELLADVMDIMLTDELRERLGQTYSPNASASLSDDFPGFGTIAASSNVDFADIAASEAAIAAIAARLVAEPVSADLLQRARQPLIEQMTQGRRQNPYWLNYVTRATSEPDRLDRSRQSIAAVQAVTPADVQAMAARYLRPDRMLRLRVVSASAPMATGTATPTP